MHSCSNAPTFADVCSCPKMLHFPNVSPLLQIYICAPMCLTFTNVYLCPNVPHFYKHIFVPQCAPLLQMYICAPMCPTLTNIYLYPNVPHFYKCIFVRHFCKCVDEPHLPQSPNIIRTCWC